MLFYSNDWHSKISGASVVRLIFDDFAAVAYQSFGLQTAVENAMFGTGSFGQKCGKTRILAAVG
ncbi:hypothetical protein C7W93_21375 [Glaciimonas sp. PCH181]|nr:hypothetical protein C7W93_21375 [Glaciimonas sp. PCH181]